MPKESSDEYELVPYKEIQELKDELKQLKGFPVPDSKKMQVTMVDLAAKIDKLTIIFEEASHQLKVEEGGLTFQEKMKPLLEKMNKILEQNSEIAEGIVALADIVSDLKDKMEKGFVVRSKEATKTFESEPFTRTEKPAFPPSVQPVFAPYTPQQTPLPPITPVQAPVFPPMNQNEPLPPPFPGLPPPPEPKRKLL